MGGDVGAGGADADDDGAVVQQPGDGLDFQDLLGLGEVTGPADPAACSHILPFLHLPFIIERLLVNLAAIQAQIYSRSISDANANRVTAITL